MDKFLIKGGKALHGTVSVSGAKNSALPVMAAALLTSDQVSVHNIPKVRDLITMSKLLAFMGASISVTEMPASDYSICAPTLNHAEAPYELVKTMRASILTLGPLMARLSVARVSLPGGCAIGARPIDLHLAALEKMGAEITMSHGYIEAKVTNHGRLQGAHIIFEKITVTGTENILMAATLADGETILENAACEPEVTDLVVMLRKMGACIAGEGTSTLRIRGVKELHGTEHTIIPDRIEAGTFLVAGAVTDKQESTPTSLMSPHCASTPRRNSRPPTSPLRNTPASPPTCRRSTWPWPRKPKAPRSSPKRFSRIATSTPAK